MTDEAKTASDEPKTLTINGVELTEGQARTLLWHVLWGRTIGADLDFREGCAQAATAVVDVLANVDESVVAAIDHEHERFELTQVHVGVLH